MHNGIIAWKTLLHIYEIVLAEEIAKQVKDSEAKVIVTITQLAPVAREVQKLCPTLKSVIVIGEPVEGCHSFFEMIKTNSSGKEFAKGSSFDTTDEIAFLPYSSGTTGIVDCFL